MVWPGQSHTILPIAVTTEAGWLEEGFGRRTLSLIRSSQPHFGSLRDAPVSINRLQIGRAHIYLRFREIFFLDRGSLQFREDVMEKSELRRVLAVVLFGLSCGFCGQLIAASGDEPEPETEGEEESSFGTFGGSVLITSNYMFRSISNSNDGPAVQGDMNWSHDVGFYAGLWASNTNFGGPGNSMELDPYFGFAGNFGESDFSFDIGYWSYNYPKSAFDLDYGEIYVYVTYTKDKFSVSPSVWYAENYFGEDFLDDVSGIAYEVTFSYQFPKNVSASVRVGEQAFDSSFDNLDFVYWDAGIDWAIDDWSIGLRWYDTDGVDPFLASRKLTDGEFVLGITRNF